MALTTQDHEWGNLLKIKDLELEQKDKNINELKFGLMVASQREPNMESPEYRDKKINEKYKRINNPTRPTEGQLLGKSGEYLKDPETEVDTSQPLESRMFDIDPKKHRDKRKTERIHKKATDPQAQGSEKDWVKKTGPQLPKLNIKPADLLKILQLLPAFTGGGLQMAGGQELRNHLKPYTRGKNPWDTGGGSLQHLSPEERLKLTIGGIERFKV